MANVFIYAGLIVMLAGAVFGLFVAVKGYRQTDWRKAGRISYYARFTHGNSHSPEMKKLTRIWGIIMLAGLILTAIGIAIGL